VKLRKALARWLDPSIEDDRHALWRLREDLADAWWWCGEFPHVAATAAWVRLTDQRRWTPWEKYHAMVMNGTGPRWEFTAQIGDFREWLRRASEAEIAEAVRGEAQRTPDFTPIAAEESK
jgi:hypothetical protein